MAELARGAVSDRPWGRTLGALGVRGVTGQLTLTAESRRFHVAFAAGAVVGAASPLASDAAARVALTGGLISSTQVADLARRQAAAPERDEIELIAELIRLAPEQAMRLRRRALAQRAARTFSVDRGEFVVEDRVTVPVVAGSELDVRSVIFLGARQNLPEARLAADLASIGAWFRLQPSALEDLPQYGFTEAERPVLERLRAGITLEEIDGCGVEPRVARAMVYALVSCGGCEIGGAGRAAVATGRFAPAAGAGRSRVTTRAPVGESRAAPAGALGGEAGKEPRLPAPAAGPGAPAVTSGDARTASSPQIAVPGAGRPARAAATGPSASQGSSPGIAVHPALGSSPGAPAGRPTPRALRRVADPGQADDVRALIAQRLRLVEHGADHFQLLGVPVQAPPDAVRKAYFALARQLHPDRLAALAIEDAGRQAQRLFAQVNTAFAVLSDPRRRGEYEHILRRGGEAAVRAEQAQADALAQRILESEDAFQRGEAALRRDQLDLAVAELSRAVSLNPDEPEYHATLAWAQFCAARDKAHAAPPARAALERAIAASPRAVHPRLFLGRVERMVGRDQEALRHFHEVLRLAPHHHDAATEVRLIEQRLAGPPRRR